MFEGVFLGNEKFPELNKVINELAEKYNVTDSAIAVAWILRHPAGIQTIIGTTNKERIAQISKASNVHLTREEWYRLYMLPEIGCRKLTIFKAVHDYKES